MSVVYLGVLLLLSGHAPKCLYYETVHLSISVWQWLYHRWVSLSSSGTTIPRFVVAMKLFLNHPLTSKNPDEVFRLITELEESGVASVGSPAIVLGFFVISGWCSCNTSNCDVFRDNKRWNGSCNFSGEHAAYILRAISYTCVTASRGTRFG